MIYSLLLSIAVSVSLCSKGLLLNHPEAPISQFYNDQTNTVDIPNLIKQYVGLGEENQIKNSQIEYLIFFESDEVPNIQNSFPVQVQDCSQDQTCILDQILDQSNQTSIVNSLQNIYHKNLVYFITNQQQLVQKYSNNNIFFQNNKNQMMLKEKTGKWQYKVKYNVVDCVNQFANPKYQISSNSITYENQQIKFDETSQGAYNNFLSELCAFTQISTLVEQENVEPNVYVFFLKSFSELQQKINSTYKPILLEIVGFGVKQFQSNLLKSIDSSQISGQLITTSSQSQSSSRILLSESDNLFWNPKQVSQSNQNKSYLIQIWLSVVMIFVLFYVLSSMFNMDIGQDTLLYAKFLTLDAK